jgi:hypothetical protein
VSVVDQAAEALSAEWWKVYDDDSRPTVHDEANALAAAGLLRPPWATPQAKAVLDYARKWWHGGPGATEDLRAAVEAHVASLDGAS